MSLPDDVHAEDAIYLMPQSDAADAMMPPRRY